MKPHRLIAVALALMLPLVTLAADNHDPAIGTWKLDLGKSALHDPVPKSEIRKYEVAAEGATKMTIKYEEADGTKGSAELVYKLDGKDYPVKDGQGYDTVAATLVDRYTVTFDLKKGGKTVGTFKRTVSPDGKTLTAVSTRMGESGPETAVYAKQ